MTSARKSALPVMPVTAGEALAETSRKARANKQCGATLPILDVEGVPVASPEDSGTETALVQTADRTAGGRFTAGNSFASLGGRARRGKVRMVESLGLRPHGDTTFAKHQGSAKALRLQLEKQLRNEYDLDENLPPTASGFLAASCLQFAWALTFSDEAASTGRSDLAIKSSQLLDRHRINVEAAREECRRARAVEVKRRNDAIQDELRAKAKAREEARAKLTPEERRKLDFEELIRGSRG